MIILLSIIWLLRTIKSAFFYIYLWQLKEYQIKRFLDHFRTEKGKKLIFNKLNLLKVLFLAVFVITFFLIPRFREGFFNDFVLWFGGLIALIYFVEIVFALKNIFQKRFKIPVLTKKVFVLLGLAALVIIAFFTSDLLLTKDIGFFAFGFLCFDILAPLIFSLVVLALQPVAIFLRNKDIEKAKNRISQYTNLIVVGVTGSYGKTSTKEFLAAILSEKFKVLKTKEHQNSEIGVAQAILNDLVPEHQIFVCEMASYAKGGIKLIADIIKPKLGIVAGINEQHLALFGSMENLISAEGGEELKESLPDSGKMILNWDNKLIRKNYSIDKKNIRCSVKEQADFWAENIRIKRESVSFKIISKEGESTYLEANVLGGHNVENILLAAAAAKELGMNFQEIAKSCLKIKPEQGAMKLFKNQEGVNIIDSSYSANPDGVLADLDYLKTYSGKKIIIMPSLIELGPAAKEVHERIGRKIGEVCDSAIITTEDYLEEIQKGAAEVGLEKGKISFAEDPEEILRRIEISCTTDDAVLLEGRGPRVLLERLISR